MTCRDFIEYLLYVEHCAENLQFFLWYKDYAKRFENLSASEQCLSPEYTQSRPPPIGEATNQPQQARTKTPKVTLAVQRFVDNAFAARSNKTIGLAPPSPALSKPNSINPADIFGSPGTSTTSGHLAFSFSGNTSIDGINYKQVTAEAFEEAEIKWQPCKYFPIRLEG